MAALLRGIVRIELKTIYRSTDPKRLTFLNHIRDKQPTKKQVQEYFDGRTWDGNLQEAVWKGLLMQNNIQNAFVLAASGKVHGHFHDFLPLETTSLFLLQPLMDFRYRVIVPYLLDVQ